VIILESKGISKRDSGESRNKLRSKPTESGCISYTSLIRNRIPCLVLIIAGTIVTNKYRDGLFLFETTNVDRIAQSIVDDSRYIT